MGLVQDIPLLLEEFKAQADRIEHDRVLYEIYEGDLKTYLLKALSQQLSKDSFTQAVHRIAPINVLPRIVGKLSIYGKVPARSLGEKAQDKDTELWADVEKVLKLNPVMTEANKLFNLHKRVWIEPFLDQGTPSLRVIPSHKFFVYSNDPVNPLRPTHFVKIMGKVADAAGQESILFYGYTASEFVAFNSKGELVQQKNVTNGVNPLGKLPGVYVNRSKSELVPMMDTDTLPMTLLIPTILTDVNYAHMFTHFPIFYGINLTDEGMVRAPNRFWKFKSDPGSEGQPTVGILEPGLDTQKSIELVKSQLSFWMQARNIKPGAMGSLSVENAASGISKAIDEMDTSEDRQAQVPIFQDAEEMLLKLFVETLHPAWQRVLDYKFKAVSFTPGVEVAVKFPEQRPIVDSSKAIDDQKKKIDMGIQDEFGAMKELYPDMTDQQIEEHLKRVQKRKLEKMKEAQAAMGTEVDPETGKPMQPGSNDNPQGDKEANGGDQKPEPAKSA